MHKNFQYKYIKFEADLLQYSIENEDKFVMKILQRIFVTSSLIYWLILARIPEKWSPGRKIPGKTVPCK